MLTVTEQFLYFRYLVYVSSGSTLIFIAVNSDKRLLFIRQNTSTSKYDGCIHSIQFFFFFNA